MKINDLMLSAFLDAELSQDEMELVRTALETDDDLLIRMADFSQIDQWVVEYAQQIDETPVPEKTVLLAQQLDEMIAGKVQPLPSNDPSQSDTSNVVPLSAWKKVSATIARPYSIAASVALMVTVGIMNFSVQSPESGYSSQLASILNNTLSGEITQLQNNATVTAQLSFINQQGQFCRQYKISNASAITTNIACNHAGEWQNAASFTQEQQQVANYQTASSNKTLDLVIDQMISGAPLDRKQEQQAILTDWQ